MSKHYLAIELAQELEEILSEFLNLSRLEQIQKAEDFFQTAALHSELRKARNVELFSKNQIKKSEYYFQSKLLQADSEKFQKISLMFKESKNSYKEFLDNSDDEGKEFSEFAGKNDLETYFEQQCQLLIERLPYYFLLTHIIFDDTNFSINDEKREELREICGLKAPGQRQDAFVGLFKFLLNDKVTDGGKETGWNEWTRLHFLSLFERFCIVIENARKEVKEMKLKKMPVVEREKKNINKYNIPKDLYSDLEKRKRDVETTARKWAKYQLQKEISPIYVKKMGWTDSHLRTEVLPLAREEAAKYLKSDSRNYENHKLIFVNLRNPNILNILAPPKDFLTELKYDSFIKKRKVGTELYFL